MATNKILIYLILSAFISHTAFAAKKKEDVKLSPTIQINKIDASSSNVEVDLQLQNTSKEAVEFAATLGEKSKLSIKAVKTPVNLWVFLDSSALCKHLKFGEYTKDLIPMLKETLHESSTVSIVSYRNKKQFFFYNQVKVNDLKGLNFDCVPDARSVSYEKALTELLGKKEKVSLPTHVWVFSSGNALISNSAAAELKKRSIAVRLIVYNPVVKFQMKRVSKKTLKQLGNDLFSYALAAPAQLKSIVPSSYYKAEFKVPRKNHGTNQTIKLEAVRGEDKVAEMFTSVFVKKSSLHEVINWLIYGGYALLVFLFFYLIYRIIRYYKPQKCGNCGQFMRHADEYCLNCQKDIKGYLIVKNLSNTKALPIVTPIGKKRIKVGTASSCKIKLNKTQNGEAINYFTVRTEVLRLAGRTFTIAPNSFMENVNVKVNGSFLSGEKYLSSGDKIEVPGYEINLFFEKEIEHA